MEVRSTLRQLLGRPNVRTAAIVGVGVLALISLTYLGPDLLGRRIWQQTREKLEKQGEPLAWETYLPRPVPDEQNIFKAPKIAEWFLRPKGSPNLYANANLYPTEWRIKLGIFDQTLRQITPHPVATVTLGDHNEADLTLRYQNDTFDPAPNLPPEEPVSIISFKDVPLRTAFENLARHSGLTIQYDPSLILAWDATTNATKPTGVPISQGNIPRDPSIKGRWENKTIRAVIHRILESYGLGYQEEEPGTIRVLPQPVPTPAQKKVEALLAAGYQAHPQNYSVGLLSNVRGRSLTFASDNQTNNPITIAVVGPDQPTVAEIQKLFPPKLAPGGPAKKGGWEVESLGSNQFQVFYENNGNYSAQAYLALNDQIKTDWKLVSEGLARPAAHIDDDFHRPFEVVVPDYVAVRLTAQTLAERAQCHLLTGQPEAALEDLTCLHNLRRVMASQPTTLVAAMFDVAISGLHVNMVADGLRLRAWEEPQINALQAQLNELNLPQTVQTAMRTQRAAMCQTVLNNTREELDETLRANERNAPLWNQIRNPTLFLIHFAPCGVLLQNLANLAEAEQSEITQYDARKDQIFPRPPSTNSEPSGPYNILIGHYLGGTGTAAWKAAARNQTLANQARVALALERYHLLHHQYPDHLTALQPDFLDVIPRDLIGGQPMQYSQTNGEFNLTSASWPKATPTGTWEWLAPNQ